MTDEDAMRYEEYIIPADQQLIIDGLTTAMFAHIPIPPPASKSNIVHSVAIDEDDRNGSTVPDVTCTLVDEEPSHEGASHEEPSHTQKVKRGRKKRTISHEEQDVITSTEPDDYHVVKIKIEVEEEMDPCGGFELELETAQAATQPIQSDSQDSASRAHGMSTRSRIQTLPSAANRSPVGSLPPTSSSSSSSSSSSTSTPTKAKPSNDSHSREIENEEISNNEMMQNHTTCTDVDWMTQPMTQDYSSQTSTGPATQTSPPSTPVPRAEQRDTQTVSVRPSSVPR